ncbi:hypothetical protein BMETH_1342_1 [methanotrophic bacterial endosymbiont of Bathymodiolus sp.]|nr:hypothetical protein BMETH_1342_1 [methanotrophic bacterial endosymbiont of Bathymodiolus sp.]
MNRKNTPKLLLFLSCVTLSIYKGVHIHWLRTSSPSPPVFLSTYL